MKLDAPWCRAPATRAVMAALSAKGAVPLFVGGCVRNALLGREVADVDIATPTHPGEVIALAKAAGMKAVPTGLEHGTITIVTHGTSFEVTTFRRDVETDGRRAVVAFSETIEEDAHRRDFTMNALYALADGTVVDPLGSIDDLTARRLRFVGDPGTRIREDYLRILRFFRFHAIYAHPHTLLDPEGLAACAALQDGLARVSRERIGDELRKLLAAEDPANSLCAMSEAGILGAVLPKAHSDGVQRLVLAERAAEVPPRWIRRLAVLNAAEPASALRLSRKETREVERIDRAVSSGLSPAALAAEYGEAIACDAILLRADDDIVLPPHWRAEVARGSAAIFPVSATDLLPQMEAGPELGQALNDLRQRWLRADLVPDKKTLLTAMGT